MRPSRPTGRRSSARPISWHGKPPNVEGMLGCRVQPEHVRISGKAITVFEASLRSPRAGAIGSTKEREEA